MVKVPTLSLVVCHHVQPVAEFTALNCHLLFFAVVFQMYVPNMMPWPPAGVFEAAAIQPFANGGFPNPGPPTSGGFPSSPTNIHPRFSPMHGAMSGRRPFDSGPGHHHAPHQPAGPRGRHRPPYGGRDDSYGPHAGRGRRRDEDHRAQVRNRMQPAKARGKMEGSQGDRTRNRPKS